MLTLATWRISSLLANEMGPADILESFRHRIGVRYDDHNNRHGQNIIAEAMICVWCVSIWVGIALGLVWTFNGVVATMISVPFALSAGAIIVDKVTNG